MSRHSQDDEGIPFAASDDGSIEIRLVGLDRRRGVVPVVRFASEGRRAKTAQQHVAWMLQTVVGSGSRADTLYEFVQHQGLVEGASEVGVARQDVLIAQLKSVNFPPYKGIGESGDRSAAFSLIMRIVMAEQELPRNFYKDIEPYGLATLIEDLVRQLKAIIMRAVSAEDKAETVRDDKRLVLASCSPKRRSEDQRKAPTRKGRAPSDHIAAAPGIEVTIVCGSIPIVDMPNQGSIFGEHVSWLLQAAMGADSKASSLMKYIEDFDETPETRTAYDACAAQCGLTEQDMGMVSLAGLGTTVLAVGSSGKRSSMLAAIIAIALEDKGHLVDIEDQIQLMAPNLVRPFYDLIDMALKLQKRALGEDLDEQPSGGRSSSSWKNVKTEWQVPDAKRERGRDSHGSARGSDTRGSQRSDRQNSRQPDSPPPERTSGSRARTSSMGRSSRPPRDQNVRGHGSTQWAKTEKTSRSRSRLLSRFMNEK